MSCHCLVNAVLALEDHYLPDATLVLRDGYIEAFDESRRLSPPPDASVTDARGSLVGPGLIDIHTHAAGGHPFTEEPEEACAHLLKHGVTGVLPALYMSLSKAEYIAAVDRIDQARAEGKCPNILGYYMEGPYLNPDFGCDREHYAWGDAIDPADYRELLERVRSSAKVWALAPEREGIEAFARDVREAIPSIVLSVAHSRATPEQIERLMPYGLRLATHHTNAVGTITRYPECHGVCVEEAVSYRDEIMAELICDKRGIHVDPYLLRLVRKLKGEKGVALVSDSYVANGAVPPGYDGVDDINFDDMGEIAGTRLTLDCACRNMMRHTGCSPVDAFRYASLNPARLLGLSDRGRIAVGCRADLLVCDPLFHPQHVFLKGEPIL